VRQADLINDKGQQFFLGQSSVEVDEED